MDVNILKNKYWFKMNSNTRIVITKAANLATQAEKKIKKALLDIQMNYESRIY